MSIKADLSGNLEFLGLVDLMQLLGANGSSGTLRLQSKYVSGPAVVYFSAGNPIDASSGPLKGLDALYSLFGWTEGEFEFRHDNLERDKVIKNSRMEVILDGLKKLDDGQIEKLGPQALVKTISDPTGKGGIPIIKGPLIDYNFVVDEEEYAAGTHIVQEGKHGNWIWVVLEGVVDIVKNTPQGPLTIVKISEGTFIGSMASFLLEGNIRSASAIASGNVQLGVIDSQRVSNEYARLSPEFKGLLRSMDKRMFQIGDRVVDFHLEPEKSDRFIKGMKPVMKQGDKTEKLYIISSGKAGVVRSKDGVDVPLVSLENNDYFGYHPFLDMGHEPYSASIVGTEDLQYREINLEKLHNEYDRLSPTIKHIIENIATNISVTTMVAIDAYKKGK